MHLKKKKKRKTNNLLNDLTKIKTPRRVKPSQCEGRKTRGGKQKWLKRWDGWDIEGRPEFPYLVVTIQFSGCFYSGRIVRPFPVASIQIVSVCVIFCCVVNIRLVLNAIRTWISAWKMIVPPQTSAISSRHLFGWSQRSERFNHQAQQTHEPLKSLKVSFHHQPPFNNTRWCFMYIFFFSFFQRVVVFGDKCGVSFPTSQRHGIGMSDQLDAILDDKWTGIIFSAEKRASPTALFLSVMTKSRGEREKWGCFGVCMSLAASEGREREREMRTSEFNRPDKLDIVGGLGRIKANLSSSFSFSARHFSFLKSILWHIL